MQPVFAIQMPGGGEWLVILLIVLILFGAGRLPEVFGSFGKGIKAFKDAQKDDPVDVTPRNKELAERVEDASEVKEKAKS